MSAFVATHSGGTTTHAQRAEPELITDTAEGERAVLRLLQGS